MQRSTQWMAVVLVVVGAFGTACATTQTTTPKSDHLTIDLVDTKGEQVRLDDYLGQVVLVDFWATWCKPCKASFPVYEALYQANKDRGFVVLAVSVDEDDETVAAFIEAEGISFRVLRDPTGSVPERIGLNTMPTAIIIGRDGTVRRVHEGFKPEDAAKLTADIEAALDVETGGAPGDWRRRAERGVPGSRCAKGPAKPSPLSPGEAPRGAS